jgi:hypothetical protein
VKSLGARMYEAFTASVRFESIGSRRDEFETLPALEQARWNRAACAFVAGLSDFSGEWDAVVEACAVAAEAQDRIGREWVRDSLWAEICRRAGENVRALKRGRA